MSIATEITKLQNNLSNAYIAIENKGGTIPTQKTMANLSSAIDSIQGGGNDSVIDFLANNLSAINDTEGKITSLKTHACYFNTGLKYVNLPNATTAGIRAFQGCSNLLSVNMPLNSIPTYAFNNCTSLSSITLSGNSVCTLPNITSIQGLPSNYKVYVPYNLYNDYLVATNWSTITSHIEALPPRTSFNVKIANDCIFSLDDPSYYITLTDNNGVSKTWRGNEAPAQGETIFTNISSLTINYDPELYSSVVGYMGSEFIYFETIASVGQPGHSRTLTDDFIINNWEYN